MRRRFGAISSLFDTRPGRALTSEQFGNVEHPLTKGELAALTQTTARYIEGEVRRGALRAVILGRKGLRFRSQDISRWLDSLPSTEPKESVR
jgi:hypothetical protein